MKDVIELPHEHVLAQGFYLEAGRAGLKPNCVFTKKNRIVFETNSWGLRGPEWDPNKKLVVIWGDSVIFGSIYGYSHWVEKLNDKFEDYQFMNGGIEGDGLENIIARATRLNKKTEVNLNILFPGWHPSGLKGSENGQVEEWLDQALTGSLRINSALVTLPTVLSSEIVNIDFRPYLFLDSDPGDDAFFNAWSNIDPSPESMKEVYRRLIERNQIIRKVAQRHGVNLFDWFEAIRPSSFGEARRIFFDVPHPRPSASQMIADLWVDWLQTVLNDGSIQRSVKAG